MDDRTLYETILGLAAPWRVTAVEIGTEAEEVVVRLDLEEGVDLACPECGRGAPRYHRVQ